MYQLIIVDDEEKIVEGIANLFPWDKIGFRVSFFQKAAEALQFIESNPVDVVMSDIEMPGMSGIELCDRVKELDRDIKFVFISSYQNYEYFRSAIRFGVEDYLLKPIKSVDLVATFEKIREELDCRYSVKEEKAPTYYEQIICTVKQYIEENYREASLEAAAMMVHLSPSYLSKLFKEKCGSGFAEYLMKTRMEKACELLNDIQYKSYDIAYYIGYDNPKNFSRAFKAYYGVTPKEYRNGRNISGE